MKHRGCIYCCKFKPPPPHTQTQSANYTIVLYQNLTEEKVVVYFRKKTVTKSLKNVICQGVGLGQIYQASHIPHI